MPNPDRDLNFHSDEPEPTPEGQSPELSPLERLVDFETLQLRVDQLSERQQKFAHLIDPRFFDHGINPFRANVSTDDYHYETPIDLEEELFYLHPLMDPAVLEQGSVRRFPSGVNEKYIAEKYFEDPWVSEGNYRLSQLVEQHVTSQFDRLRRQSIIKLLDIGPCGGSITSLFTLQALEQHGLLDRTEVTMLDIVPNVLEATILGRFDVPQAMVDHYHLTHAGPRGSTYKERLGQGVLVGVQEWYKQAGVAPSPYLADAVARSVAVERSGVTPKVRYHRGDGEHLPTELLGTQDIVVSAYTHHHMNLFGRQALCRQMEDAARPAGFVGVADFYTPSFQAYMRWYKPHFEQYQDTPPVECPLVPAKFLVASFNHTTVQAVDESVERSFVFGGEKQPNES